MKSVHYMKFVPGVGVGVDRVGGVPDFVPNPYPLCPSTGEPAAFVAQFYIHPSRLAIDHLRCVQIYQCAGVGFGESPFPFAIAVTSNSVQGNPADVQIHPSVRPHIIEWVEDEEPDEIPLTPGFDESEERFYSSKLAGSCPFEDVLGPGERFLGQLSEYPVDFNFGGLLALLILTADGEVRIELQ